MPEQEFDPLDILGTDEQNKKFTAAEKKQFERDLNDVRKMLSLAEGERFLLGRLKNAGIFQDIVPANANMTAYDLGRRKEGLDLLRLICSADETAYLRMITNDLREIKSKKKKEN